MRPPPKNRRNGLAIVLSLSCIVLLSTSAGADALLGGERLPSLTVPALPAVTVPAVPAITTPTLPAPSLPAVTVQAGPLTVESAAHPEGRSPGSGDRADAVHAHGARRASGHDADRALARYAEHADVAAAPVEITRRLDIALVGHRLRARLDDCHDSCRRHAERLSVDRCGPHSQNDRNRARASAQGGRRTGPEYTRREHVAGAGLD